MMNSSCLWREPWFWGRRESCFLLYLYAYTYLYLPTYLATYLFAFLKVLGFKAKLNTTFPNTLTPRDPNALAD